MHKLNKGIDLFEKKQYNKAFDIFIECKEYYLAGMCKFNLDELCQSVNMFMLSIKKYKEDFVHDINTEKGTAPIIMIYLKLIESLLKMNELEISLSAMAYGLKESQYLRKDEPGEKLYNSIKITFDFFLHDNGILGEMPYECLCNDFLIFYNRKLKYLSKKSIFITLEETENNVLPIRFFNPNDLPDIVFDKNEIKSKNESMKITNETKFNQINEENKLIKTVIIMEFKKSKYLKIVKYMYTMDNSLRYFFNKKTNKLDYELILEDINIENKSDEEVLGLKENLNKKYSITKEIKITELEVK